MLDDPLLALLLRLIMELFGPVINLFPCRHGVDARLEVAPPFIASISFPLSAILLQMQAVENLLSEILKHSWPFQNPAIKEPWNQSLANPVSDLASHGLIDSSMDKSRIAEP